MTNVVSSVSSPRGRMVASWVTTALLVFELGLGSVWDLLQVPRSAGSSGLPSILPHHPWCLETPWRCCVGRSTVSPIEGLWHHT